MDYRPKQTAYWPGRQQFDNGPPSAPLTIPQQYHDDGYGNYGGQDAHRREYAGDDSYVGVQGPGNGPGQPQQRLGPPPPHQAQVRPQQPQQRPQMRPQYPPGHRDGGYPPPQQQYQNQGGYDQWENSGAQDGYDRQAGHQQSQYRNDAYDSVNGYEQYDQGGYGNGAQQQGYDNVNGGYEQYNSQQHRQYDQQSRQQGQYRSRNHPIGNPGRTGPPPQRFDRDPPQRPGLQRASSEGESTPQVQDRQYLLQQRPYGQQQQRQQHDDRPATSMSNATPRNAQRPTQRILEHQPLSPQTLAWDNPFPVFPASKKKGQQPEKSRPTNSQSQNSQDTLTHHPRHSADLPRPPVVNFDQRPGTSQGIRSHNEQSIFANSNDGLSRVPQQVFSSQPQNQAPPDHHQHGDEYDLKPPLQRFDQPRSNTLPNNVSEIMSRTEIPIRGGPSSNQHQTLQPRQNQSNMQSGFAPPSQGQFRETADGYGSAIDDYYDPNRPNLHRPMELRRGLSDESMPDFSAMPGGRTGAMHTHPTGQPLHMTPQDELPPEPPRGQPEGSRLPANPKPNHASRSNSQTNVRDQRRPPHAEAMGFDFELPAAQRAPSGSSGRSEQFDNVLPPRQPPHRPGIENPSQPAHLGSRLQTSGSHRSQTQVGPGSLNTRLPSNFVPNGIPRSASPVVRVDPQNGLPSSIKPRQGSSGSGSGPNQRPKASSPDSQQANPDALPAHPAPVRAGLMQPVVQQMQRPPPVRQYDQATMANGQFHGRPMEAGGVAPVRSYTMDSTSSQQTQFQNQPTPQQQAPLPQAPLPQSHRVSSNDIVERPVTHEEISRLRSIVQKSPSDLKTTLTLAKKLVEAAAILADGNGRADAKTRAKNRERYTLEAHKLVKRLVSQNMPEAMFYLADSYNTGRLGLAIDNKEAFTLYQSAAKVGHAKSAYRVAVCCEMGADEGGGTRKDPLKAVQWYKRAATLGDVAGMYKMGMILLKGLLGQQRNPREAISWLKRAAERADKDNPHALHELALLYESASPQDHILRDEQYSAQLFQQASDLGYKFSQFRLGAAFEHGLLGMPVDARQSIAYYSKAATQEEHQSELALSGWYLTGADGVLQQSDTEAYLWARKAAMAGLAKAEFAMGYYTETGIGVAANLEEAKRWYFRAASRNFPKARERLEELRRGGGAKKKERVSRSKMQKDGGDCKMM